MEILLAIVVASAVIFFGALISMGNERQRKAIDGLREQMVLWAVQDLKIKREHLAKTVEVPDPLGWLNKTASRVCSYDLKLQIIEVVEEPQSLICASGDGNVKIIFSPLSPTDIHRIKNGNKNRLSRYADPNLLLALPKNVTCYKITVLNSSVLFDLELPIVWKKLTTQKIEQRESLWMYSIP